MQAQTFWKLQSLAAILLMSLTFLSPMRAEAQVAVQIGGQAYEVDVLSGTTLGDIETDVINAPWWGSNSIADSFADAYDTATGGTGISTYFAYQSLAGGLLAVEVLPSGGIAALTAFIDPGLTYPAGSFVTGRAVPEIDGPVLARMALIIFALYLGLKIFRQRRFGSLAGV